MASKFSIDAVIKATDQISRPMRRIRRNVLRTVGTIVRGFARATKAVVRFTASLAKAVAKGVGKTALFGGAALATGVVMLNKAATEAQVLAKATGITVDNLEAFSAAVAPAGFNLDNINDLVEEMNNKFGEIAVAGAPKTLQEGLKAINASARELNKLAPNERFLKIVDSLMKMKNATDAASAADQIFGGEASKIIGVLRNQGKSAKDVLETFKALNFQTGESRRGALGFTNSFSKLTTVVSTAAKMIAGLLGDALTPLVQRMNEWAVANKALIQSKAKEWITQLVIQAKRLFEWFEAFIKSDGFAKRIQQITSAAQEAMQVFREINESLQAMRELTDRVGLTTPKLFTGALDDREGVTAAKFDPRLAAIHTQVTERVQSKKTENVSRVDLQVTGARAKITGAEGTGLNLVNSGMM